MKRRMILFCIIAISLVLTNVASASPKPPKKFRLKGDTTYMEFHIFDSVLPYMLIESGGQSIRNIHGTFEMTENVSLIPVSPDPLIFHNEGTLWITTKKGDLVTVSFEGEVDVDAETVAGIFVVESGLGAYDGMPGTYAGFADQCALPCDPFDFFGPECTEIPEPDCEGFYVDFVFD